MTTDDVEQPDRPASPAFPAKDSDDDEAFSDSHEFSRWIQVE